MRNKRHIVLLMVFVFIFKYSYPQQTATTTAQTGTTQPQTAVATATATVTKPAVNVVNPGFIRPSGDLGVPEVDNYVTSCYNTYDQTNSDAQQLNTIEQQVSTGKVTDILAGSLDSQLASLKINLIGLQATGLQLAQASSQMAGTAAKSLIRKPFKIPGAVLRVKNANKAVNASLKNIHTMLSETIVNINNKLHPKTAADTVKKN